MTAITLRCLKKRLNKSIASNKIDKSLLELINSDYGMMYKSTTSLIKLVYEMLKQQLKPVTNALINNNLEQIKDDTSHITLFDVTEYLDELNNIIKETNQQECN